MRKALLMEQGKMLYNAMGFPAGFDVDPNGDGRKHRDALLAAGRVHIADLTEMIRPVMKEGLSNDTD